MSKKELKESVENWKEIVNSNAFADSIAAITESTISASPLIDKVSTWAAAGTAAVAGLAITNINKMSPVYDPTEIKWLFSCLAFSIGFALVQKLMSLSCITSLKVSEEVKNRFPPVLKTYGEHENDIEKISQEHNLGVRTEYDITKVLDSYIKLYPKWTLFFIKSKFEKATKDRMYAHKLVISRFTAQVLFAFLQFLFILIFISLATIFL